MALEKKSKGLQGLLDENPISFKVLDQFESFQLEQNLPGSILPWNVKLNEDGSVSPISSTGDKLHPVGIDGTFHMMNTVLQSLGDSNKVPWIKGCEHKKVILLRDDNLIGSNVPCFTWEILSGGPGPFGSGPEGSPNTRQRKPILRAVIKDPQRPGEEIFIYSQSKDYKIKITIHANTAFEADNMRFWLETSIEVSKWYFKDSGVDQFLFSGRGADKTVTIENKTVHQRPLEYYTIIHDYHWVSVGTLKDLVLNVGMSV